MYMYVFLSYLPASRTRIEVSIALLRRYYYVIVCGVLACMYVCVFIYSLC